MFWKIYSGIITIAAIITMGMYANECAVRREEERTPGLAALHKTLRRDGWAIIGI